MSVRRRKTERNAELVSAYQAGLTLKQAGAKFGLSKQRAHQIIEKHAPRSMRPVGLTKTMKPEEYLSGARP